MKRKLFLSITLLIVLSVLITGFLSGFFLRKLYISEFKNRLLANAKLISEQVRNTSKGNPDFNSIAHKYSDLLNATDAEPFMPGNKHTDIHGIRITFMDANGVVLGDSDSDIAKMDNHINRPEIIQALNGNVGISTRYSQTLGVDELYLAVFEKGGSPPFFIRLSYPLYQLRKMEKVMSLYTLLAVLIVILISTALWFHIFSRFTRPLLEFIKAVKNISGGNYGERVSVSDAGEEVEELAQAFNIMAEKLEKTVTELTDKNLKVESIIESMDSGILAVDDQIRIILINSVACEILNIGNRDVIGKKLMTVFRNLKINEYLINTIKENRSFIDELVIEAPKGNKIIRFHTGPIKSPSSDAGNTGGILFVQDITAIKKLEQIRTDFVSNVTHELKTPLTSIRGFIETLRSGAVYNPEIAENFLQIIDIEAERLTMLINDILQLSEIESRSADINITNFPVFPLMEEVISILAGTAEKKFIELSFDAEPKSITMTANRDRIKQALINLVDNGIKYNTRGGSVALKAYSNGGSIVLSVKDTGIGIGQEHIPRIFERFYRVDKGRSRSMGGTGLGLSIVKHIVSLYSGEIRVNSEPGKGTEFVLIFPKTT